MITLADCQAFCDADAGCIDLMAKEQSLTLIEACARAHAACCGASPQGRAPECAALPGQPGRRAVAAGPAFSPLHSR
ncbi:MAG: hypothetical protein RIR00_2359 [Pseudomonadota bacterium]|jgi:transposase